MYLLADKRNTKQNSTIVNATTNAKNTMTKIFTSIICFGIMQSTFGQMTAEKEKSLHTILDETVDNKKVFGISFAFKKDTLSWQGSSGNMTIDQSYFIASTTKLFTTAIIQKIRAEGKLSLDDKISKYIDKSILSGLHIYKGKEARNGGKLFSAKLERNRVRQKALSIS